MVISNFKLQLLKTKQYLGCETEEADDLWRNTFEYSSFESVTWLCTNYALIIPRLCVASSAY